MRGRQQKFDFTGVTDADIAPLVPLAFEVADALHRRRPGFGTLDEYQSDSLIGLVKAVQSKKLGVTVPLRVMIRRYCVGKASKRKYHRGQQYRQELAPLGSRDCPDVYAKYLTDHRGTHAGAVEMVREAVAMLPGDYPDQAAECFGLHPYDKATAREIGGRHGITASGVNQRKKFLKRKLRPILAALIDAARWAGT